MTRRWLAMIVRDESAVIERCIASVMPHIDSWVICDTGSVDGTPDLIEAALHGIPGTMHHVPWVDFSTARNELLARVSDVAETDDLVWLLDADMTVSVDPGAVAALEGSEVDGFHLRIAGATPYWMPLLIRAGRTWRYVGATHEYLSNDGAVIEKAHGIVIEHHADGGTRGEKSARDLALLQAALAESPGDPRSTFYLAQTLADLGRRDEAAEMYLHRGELGGWHEEVFWSLLSAGRLLAHSDWPRAVSSFLAAHEAGPGRVEPLYELSIGHRLRSQPHAAYLFSRAAVGLDLPDARLFLDRWLYDWGMILEHSLTTWWAGRPAESLQMCDELLAGSELPDEHRALVEENRQHCLRSLA